MASAFGFNFEILLDPPFHTDFNIRLFELVRMILNGKGIFPFKIMRLFPSTIPVIICVFVLPPAIVTFYLRPTCRLRYIMVNYDEPDFSSDEDDELQFHPPSKRPYLTPRANISQNTNTPSSATTTPSTAYTSFSPNTSLAASANPFIPTYQPNSSSTQMRHRNFVRNSEITILLTKEMMILLTIVMIIW